MKKLSLEWEAVQDMYTTYANIEVYKGSLQSFCSYAENTYLLKMSHRSIQAFYDKEQMEIAGQERLKDFINPKWVEEFKKRTNKALTDADNFINKYHLKENDLPKEELFQAILYGTKIVVDLFAVFQSCQPQYSALVESYLTDLLPDKISDNEKQDILATFTLSDKKTPLLEEEINWFNLINTLTDKIGNKLPTLEEYSYSELDLHVKKFGLMRAADGLDPWSKEELYKRLLTDIQTAKSNLEKDWQKKTLDLDEKKKLLLNKYEIPDEFTTIAQGIADVGHLRLCIRVKGWMPLFYVLMNVLFIQLDKYLPYTVKQLEVCRFDELKTIFHGDYSLDKEELNERNNLVFFGLLDGKEVLWYGEEARKKIDELVPRIDLETTELKGQIAMKGKVKGECYIFHWDSGSILKEMEEMPKGAILIAGQTRPQLMPAIKKASAIVTDEGGITSHAAIVSRELGIPCIIGTKIATKIFKNGDIMEVDADEGFVRKLN